MEEQEFVQINHKDFIGYCIAKNGEIKNPQGRYIGTYYGLVVSGKYYNTSDLLFLTYGSRKRVGEYITPAERKKLIATPKNQKLKEILIPWVERKQKMVEWWFRISGDTTSGEHYQHYFIESFGRTVEEMIMECNRFLTCANCITVVEMDNLVISWSGIITTDFLSLTVFKYINYRMEHSNEHFNVSCRLYEEEYQTYGRIIQSLFRTNHSNDYNYSVEDDGFVKPTKMVKDKDDEIYRGSPVDYNTVFSDYQGDKDCEEFVLNNIDLTVTEGGKRKEYPEITIAKFNNQFNQLVKLNNRRWTLSELFVSYSQYYYVHLFDGFKRLSGETQQKIMKEIL